MGELVAGELLRPAGQVGGQGGQGQPGGAGVPGVLEIIDDRLSNKSLLTDDTK